jgi:hypothetical protein
MQVIVQSPSVREKVPGDERITPHQFRRWMATSMFAAATSL